MKNRFKLKKIPEFTYIKNLNVGDFFQFDADKDRCPHHIYMKCSSDMFVSLNDGEVSYIKDFSTNDILKVCVDVIIKRTVAIEL